MYFTFEISNPVQLKFWWYKSLLTFRFGFLWFAFGYHPLREDEIFNLVKSGVATWGKEGNDAETGDPWEYPEGYPRPQRR